MPNISLVTGASGFTGSQLANELARRGSTVRALVREKSDTSLLNSVALAEGKIQLVRGDVRDPQAVDSAIQGARDVYHIAALYREAKHGDAMYWDVNVSGTRHVLESAARHDARVLHCSTIGVHGGVSSFPSDEHAPFSPSDIYQQTKLAGEQLAREAAARGQHVTIVRPAGIYGPGDLRFLKLFRLVRHGRFVMFGNGKTFLHLVYVDDLVRGMIQALESPAARGETMILAGDGYVTLSELVRLVAEACHVKPRCWKFPLWPLMLAATTCETLCKPFGVEPPLHRRRASFLTKNRAFSIDFARKLIGYQPQMSLVDGLQNTADWYFSRSLLE